MAEIKYKILENKNPELESVNPSTESILPDSNQSSKGDLSQYYTDTKSKGDRGVVASLSRIPFVSELFNQVVQELDDAGTAITDTLMGDPRFAIYAALEIAKPKDIVYGMGDTMSLRQMMDWLTYQKNNLKGQAEEWLYNKAEELIFGKSNNSPASDEDAVNGAGGNGSSKTGADSTENSKVTKTYRIVNSSAFKDKLAKAVWTNYQKLAFTNDGKPADDRVDIRYWGDKGETYTAPTQGRKSVMGFSLDNSFLWDISLYPYYGTENDNTNFLSVPPSGTLSPGSGNEGKQCWIPAIEYNYQEAKMNMLDIPLSSGMGIEIPSEYSLINTISTTIVDNQWGDWYKYFSQCMDRTVSLKNNLAAPYKHVTFQLNLYVLDVGLHVRFLRKLLVILSGFEKGRVGTEDSSIVTYQLNFKVVGEIDD